MEIEAKVEKKNMAYTRCIGTSQVVVQCDIKTDNGIKQVLSVTGDAIPVDVNAHVGEAKVRGKVCYKVIYLDESDALCNVEYCSDFEESIGCSDVTESSVLTPELCLRDIDHMVKDGALRLQAVVDISLDMLYENSIDAVARVSGALVQCKDIETSTHICHIDDVIDVNDEYNTGCNVDEILSFCTAATVTSARAKKDAILVSGEACSSIVYMSDGKVVTKNITMPYSEELRCLGADDTSTAIVHVVVKDAKIVLTGVEDDNTMQIEIALGVCGDVFEYSKSRVVSDAYSPCCDIDVTHGQLTYDKIVEYRVLSERISAEVSVPEDAVPIKKLIAATTLPCPMTNVKVESKNVSIETLVDACIVYMDEENICHSIDVDVPAVIEAPSECIEEGDAVDAKVVVTSAVCRVKRERDIDVMLEVVALCDTTRHMSYEVVTGVQAGADHKDTHKAISIYCVREGDTLWDVEKGIGADEDTIRACNPDLDTEHLVGGERVVVVRCANS